MTFHAWLTHEPVAINLEFRSPGTDIVNPLSSTHTHLCSSAPLGHLGQGHKHGTNGRCTLWCSDEKWATEVDAKYHKLHAT